MKKQYRFHFLPFLHGVIPSAQHETEVMRVMQCQAIRTIIMGYKYSSARQACLLMHITHSVFYRHVQTSSIHRVHDGLCQRCAET